MHSLLHVRRSNAVHGSKKPVTTARGCRSCRPAGRRLGRRFVHHPGLGRSIDLTSNGAEQTFNVPAGVTSLHVTLVGAPGASGGSAGIPPGGAGANGAKVTADIAVNPGDVLYVEVGGPASNSIGTGTGVTGATSVHFGSAAAASFTVNSDTSITAVTPAVAAAAAETRAGGAVVRREMALRRPAPIAIAAAVAITVTTPGGTSDPATGPAFVFLAVPAPPPSPEPVPEPPDTGRPAAWMRA